MGNTLISDIIVPEVFNPYLVEKTAELSALVQSGIVVPDEELDELAIAGGKLINMPFFKDLSGKSSVLDDANPLVPQNIGTNKDVAALLMRGSAWGVNDLAKALSGADPMGEIAKLVAAFWSREEQKVLIATLNGMFADNIANDTGDLVLDVSIETGDTATANNLIGGETIIDAGTKLGDSAGKLTAMAMHSTPFSRLQKNNLIETVEESESKVKIPYFQGKRVLVDDSCPVEAATTSGNVYTTYLFGQGAVGRGEGRAPVPVETGRDVLSGNDILVNRRHFLLHPRGIAFQNATVAGKSPSDEELALAANWSRVYEQKNIRIVQLKTNG